MTRSPRRLSKQVREAVGEHVRDLPVQAARLAMFGVGRALLISDRVTKDYKELRGSGPRPVLNRLRGDVQHLAGKAVTRVTDRVAGPGEPTTAPTAPETEDVPVARPPAKGGDSPVAEPEIAVGKPSSAAPGGTTEATPTPKAAPARTARTTTASSPAAPEPVTAPGSTAEPVAAARPEPQAEPAPEPKARPKAAPKPASKAAPRAAAPKAAAKAASKAASKAKIAAESLPVPDYDQASLASLRGRLRNLSAEQVRQLRTYERENAARADVLRMYENRIAKLDQG
ncbi:hypothetical protein [Actinomadura sp. HBU206391]|uniref:hypothetical protein n=1 Tax=Actinomadura sp. HBU206391 TaxID=2731692 RepID=UPI001650B919|nr:hypothetical protein [Actinomadura sp. HBU206391]MBC6457515.1 hypothetical protein [Actinomadura sp. HBU206391]